MVIFMQDIWILHDYIKQNDFWTIKVCPKKEQEIVRLTTFTNRNGGHITIGYEKWTNDQLINLHKYLKEFVINYVSEKTVNLLCHRQ